MLDRVWLVCRDDRFKDDIRCERGTFAGLCICDDVMLVDENRNVFSASSVKGPGGQPTLKVAGWAGKRTRVRRTRPRWASTARRRLKFTALTDSASDRMSPCGT